jgi:hypothetical protein
MKLIFYYKISIHYDRFIYIFTSFTNFSIPFFSISERFFLNSFNATCFLSHVSALYTMANPPSPTLLILLNSLYLKHAISPSFIFFFYPFILVFIFIPWWRHNKNEKINIFSPNVHYTDSRPMQYTKKHFKYILTPLINRKETYSWLLRKLEFYFIKFIIIQIS